MGSISLFVSTANVNDFEEGALTANRLLSPLWRKDPVQITRNRPLVSDLLRVKRSKDTAHTLRDTSDILKTIRHANLKPLNLVNLIEKLID